ncbi:MAG: hypothetical protein OEX07_01790, partial [Gammaproteobacteria bacterium]|nr:hypothetical protein [Gammaproteobacteria bacterium]
RFAEFTGIELSTLITSSNVVINGLSSSVPITIENGAFSINGAEFSNVESTVSNGDTIQIQHKSSDKASTKTETILTIGETSVAFTSITKAIVNESPDSGDSNNTEPNDSGSTAPNDSGSTDTNDSGNTASKKSSGGSLGLMMFLTLLSLLLLSRAKFFKQNRIVRFFAR